MISPPPSGLLATPSRRAVLRGVLGLAAVSVARPSWAASADPVPLMVLATGSLPGFRSADREPYLLKVMAAAHLDDWRFVPRLPDQPVSPNRVEWKFTLNPYAGGAVRRLAPTPAVDRLFGVHRPLSAELRLYLDGEYQTLQFGQVKVTGGMDDIDLADFVTKLSQSLLGPHGAYRSIQGKAKPGGAEPSYVSARPG